MDERGLTRIGQSTNNKSPRARLLASARTSIQTHSSLHPVGLPLFLVHHHAAALDQRPLGLTELFLPSAPGVGLFCTRR